MAQASTDDVPNDDTHPSIDSPAFLRHGADVRVSSREGFLCKMYALLTHADNAAIFKAIDTISDRRVDLDTPERKEIYIEQTSTVGVLFFKRQFTTALNVVELPNELSASFDLAKPGVMSAFQGRWDLAPVTATEYKALIQQRVPAHRWIHSLAHPNANDKTMFSIDQDVAPAIAQKVPPWLHGLLRRICAAAVNDVYQDMTVVAELRHRGMPMEEILQSKIHGRGGLIRTFLCATPAPAPPGTAAPAGDARAKAAVGSHAVDVSLVDDDSASGEDMVQAGAP